jgi:hypothetical protein
MNCTNFTDFKESDRGIYAGSVFREEVEKEDEAELLLRSC